MKEHIAWAAKAKKMKKLEVDMVEMEKAMSQFQRIHQAELERKDAFCEAEKDRVIKEL